MVEQLSLHVDELLLLILGRHASDGLLHELELLKLGHLLGDGGLSGVATRTSTQGGEGRARGMVQGGRDLVQIKGISCGGEQDFVLNFSEGTEAARLEAAGVWVQGGHGRTVGRIGRG